MSTEELSLSAVGYYDDFALAAGSTKVAACATPDDDSTSYISSDTSPSNKTTFTLSDPADISADDTINKVTVRVRMTRGGTPAPSGRQIIRYNSTDANGVAYQTGASWVDYSHDFTEKPGGGAWDLTALQGLEAGVEHTAGTKSLYCTTVEVIVDYTVASATDDLTAADLTAGTPTLDTPTLARIVNLTPEDLVAGTPALDTPTLQGTGHLTASDLTAGTPTLDTPTLQESAGTDDLTAADLTAGTPTLDTPTLARIVNLTAEDLVAGTPALDTPTLEGIGHLTASDLTAGTLTLDTPTLAEPGPQDNLTAADLTAGTPTLDTPTLYAWPAAVASDLLFAAWLFSLPSLYQPATTTPDRIATPRAESRTATPRAASRTATVEGE